MLEKYLTWKRNTKEKIMETIKGIKTYIISWTPQDT